MTIKGYYVRDSSGRMIEKIEGTVDRRVLNKHRAKGHIIKKIKNDKRSTT